MLLGAWMVDNHERERQLFHERGSAKDHLNLIRAQLDNAIQKDIQVSKGVAYSVIQNPTLTPQSFQRIVTVWLFPRTINPAALNSVPLSQRSVQRVTLLRPGQETFQVIRSGPEEPLSETDLEPLQTLYDLESPIATLPASELRDRLTIRGSRVVPQGDRIQIQVPIIDRATQESPQPSLWGVVQITLSATSLGQQLAPSAADNAGFQNEFAPQYRYLIAREGPNTGDRQPIFGDESLLEQWSSENPQREPVIDSLPFARETWQMAIIPENGWLTGYRRSNWIYGIGGLLTVVAMVIVYRWVDTPVQLRSEVSQQQKRFQEIFEQAAVGIYRTDSKGTIIEVNQRLCQLVDYSEPEMIGLDMMALTHPDDRRTDWPTPWYMGHGPGQMGPHQSTYNFSTRFIRKSGHVQWVNLSISLASDDEQGGQYAIVVVEDIAERKQAEDSLRASEERWQLALQGNNDGIWDWNPPNQRSVLLPSLERNVGLYGL